MQKKLIALAIAGLSSAAFAQSNVTISGQMKVSVDNVGAGGCSAAACTNYTSRTRVSDNNSNLRFSGEESLGGGMAAWFQVESAIGTGDNNGTTTGKAGTNTTTIGARNTAVGLKGGWGTALVGKWDVHYTAMVPVEKAGLADGLALAASSLNLTNSINGVGVTGSGRDPNVVAYVSPDFSGFSALLGYTFISEATTPGLLAKDRGWTIAPKYVNGPIAVVWSHLSVDNAGATGATKGTNIRSDKVGASYAFPMGFKVGLIWDRSKMNSANTGVELGKRTTWALPLSYNTGAHGISFTWGKAGDTSVAGTKVNNTAARMWMLGYEYAMSKRTSVSATYSSINNDSAGAYDFWHPSSNVNGAGAGLATPGADPRMLSFTLLHRF